MTFCTKVYEPVCVNDLQGRWAPVEMCVLYVQDNFSFHYVIRVFFLHL